MQEKAQAVGGYAAVESAPVSLPDRDRLPWGWPDDPLAKGLRAMRDPRGLLNPGRVHA
jgi:hypothetical protein